MDISSVSQLLNKHRKGVLSEEETKALEAWIDAAPENRQAFDSLMNPSVLREQFLEYYHYRTKSIQTVQTAVGTSVVPEVQHMHFLKTVWFRYAAILLLLAGVATWLFIASPSFKRNPDVAAIKPSPLPDIAPGGNKATLTLADGSTILLDNAADGKLAEQGNTKIIKLNTGSLAYEAQSAGGELLYNTITTPKGGQYQITLPDGSKVWLNAASSVRFPTAFTGKDRRVELSGEAYFEIEKDKARPFFVELNDRTKVEVLGTGFNVNSYSDDAFTTITLLEGMVQVFNGKNKVLLNPGEAAQSVAGEKISFIKNADIGKAIAWKNGLFNFEDASLKEVMNQVQRWYDIEVVYEKGIPDIRFGGELSRNTRLSSLIKALEMSKVHFRIEEGRKLVVLP